MNKCVIISGINGFVGSALRHYLEGAGYIVVDPLVIADDSIYKDATVINLGWHGTSGALRGEYKVQIENIKSSCELFERSAENGCHRFINAGSIMEYEIIPSLYTDENNFGINTLYSAGKLSADLMLQSMAARYNVAYNNIIISNIYGPGEKSQRFLNTILRKMMKNEHISMTEGKQKYDFIYIDDAVRAIEYIIRNGSHFSRYYIGNSQQRSLREYVEEMKEVLLSDSSIGYGEVPYVDNGFLYENLDCSKLERMGFKIETSFSDGILKTRDWIEREEIYGI